MSVRLVAHAVANVADDSLEESFPGRWNPRRALDPPLRPLARAVGEALAGAGWWTSGSGEPVAGGLVVGVDGYGWDAAATFRQQLEAGATLRPSVFLHSLPSTPAATLGLLFGLVDYQATLAAGGQSGLQALSHAVDPIRLGRAARLVVAVLSVAEGGALARGVVGAGPDTPPFLQAAAWCLEAGQGWPQLEVELEREAPPEARSTGDLLLDIDPGYRGRAAPALLAATRALEEGRAGLECSLVHEDPGSGRAWLRLRGADERGE